MPQTIRIKPETRQTLATLAKAEATTMTKLPWAERPWHVAQESVLATCRHMLDAVKAGRPAATSAADNLKTFALVEAAYQAAGKVMPTG